jgi:hypothetical protein
MTDATKRLADVILASTQLLLVLIGGVWVYFRFRRERTHNPRVSLDIAGTFLGPQQDAYVAEFLLTIKNAGMVKHHFSEISLRVRGIRDDAPVGLWGDTQRVVFPEKVVSDADVLHKTRYASIFVEPGVTQVITFVARVPADIRFVLARAVFNYDETRTHSAERVFEITGRVA